MVRTETSCPQCYPSAFTTDAVYTIAAKSPLASFGAFVFAFFVFTSMHVALVKLVIQDLTLRFGLLFLTPLPSQIKRCYSVKLELTFFVSETSCTAATQREEQRLLKDDLGFSVQWGCPVPPHSETSKGDNARRGQFLGVAILSKFPTRPPRLPIEDPYFRSCRFQETWIKVHSINLCVIVIYAFTDAHPNSREKKRVLLSYALQRACQAGPFVAVTGDFNNALKNLPDGLHFRHHGFVDTLEWARWHFPSKIHPTCHGVSF